MHSTCATACVLGNIFWGGIALGTPLPSGGAVPHGKVLVGCPFSTNTQPQKSPFKGFFILGRVNTHKNKEKRTEGGISNPQRILARKE